MSGRSVTRKMYFSDTICEGKGREGGILYTTHLPSNPPRVLPVLVPGNAIQPTGFGINKRRLFAPTRKKKGTVPATFD